MTTRENTDLKKALLSGNEALAQGAYEAGLKVAAAYPGTPSSEIMEYLVRFDSVDTQWSVNEKVAFEVALGASIGGVRSLYASKHVGLNVAMDPLMTSAYTGITGGFVIVTADDPGLHSSQNEQDNRLVAPFAKMPLLEPSSPGEAREFMKAAFEISELCDTPVILRTTTRISHTKEDVLFGTRTEIEPRTFIPDPAKYVMVPANAYRKHIEIEKKLLVLAKLSDRSPLNRAEIKSNKIGFITSGISYLYAKDMFPEASFLKLGMTFPLPEKKIRAFVAKVKDVYVLEELEPFLENQIKALGIKCKAKHPSFRVGELRPEFIPGIAAGKAKKEKIVVSRKPTMCPGCGHRPVFAVLKKVKAVVSGDIGCYTLGALPPLAALHTCVCMGAGVTIFDGIKRAGQKNVVGIIGDSTFVHSGITGLINAAYNKQKGLLIILDNSTTAMTGGQPNPSTGLTIRGEHTKKLDLAVIAKACGADNVDIIDPFRVKELEQLVRKRMEEDALSVIIAKFPCRFVESNKRSVPLLTHEKCKKCYLCLGIGCPAISKHEDQSVRIDPRLCTGCGLCVSTCPFGALEIRNNENFE